MPDRVAVRSIAHVRRVAGAGGGGAATAGAGAGAASPLLLLLREYHDDELERAADDEAAWRIVRRDVYELAGGAGEPQ